MVIFNKIKSIVKTGIALCDFYSENIKLNIINIKGIYSKPKNETSLVLNVGNSRSKKVVICLQKHINNLNDGDVILTNDKSEILLCYNDNTINIKGEVTFNDNVIFNNNVIIKGNLTIKGSVINTGIDSHIHATAYGNTLPPTKSL